MNGSCSKTFAPRIMQSRVKNGTALAVKKRQHVAAGKTTAPAVVAWCAIDAVRYSECGPSMLFGCASAGRFSLKVAPDVGHRKASWHMALCRTHGVGCGTRSKTWHIAQVRTLVFFVNVWRVCALWIGGRARHAARQPQMLCAG